MQRPARSHAMEPPVTALLRRPRDASALSATVHHRSRAGLAGYAVRYSPAGAIVEFVVAHAVPPLERCARSLLGNAPPINSHGWFPIRLRPTAAPTVPPSTATPTPMPTASPTPMPTATSTSVP